jgi:hypothetical protein
MLSSMVELALFVLFSLSFLPQNSFRHWGSSDTDTLLDEFESNDELLSDEEFVSVWLVVFKFVLLSWKTSSSMCV